MQKPRPEIKRIASYDSGSGAFYFTADVLSDQNLYVPVVMVPPLLYTSKFTDFCADESSL